MLNFSNSIFRRKNFFLLLLFPVLLNGCIQFSGNQPPAPIYGASQSTNPYATPSVDAGKQLKNKENNVYSESNRNVSILKPDDNTNGDTSAITKPSSPAVLALITEADNNTKAGDFESAVATIERALRIDPRNPALTYKLATVRLKQSKPRLAEDLAKKAALLSANDRMLKKQVWLLISEARRQQNNLFGAEEAKLKANKI